MPIRTVPKNYRNVTGIAASPKAGGAAQFESTLERDFLSLLEFSPEVKIIDPQYEPSKLKLPGFVVLGIKMATAAVSTPGNEAFAKVVIAPGNSDPVFPLPRLVDEDGVVDPITDCSNADKTIRQRWACFLRIEDIAGELFQFVVVIEEQKLAMPPVVRVVRKVELAEVVRTL